MVFRVEPVPNFSSLNISNAQSREVLALGSRPSPPLSLKSIFNSRTLRYKRVRLSVGLANGIRALYQQILAAYENRKSEKGRGADVTCTAHYARGNTQTKIENQLRLRRDLEACTR